MGEDINRRFWELDFLRGIAIIMMIIFHVLFDLKYFGGYDFYLNSGFWMLFGRATAAIFILLVGISLTLSHSRERIKGRKDLFKKYRNRGLKIFSWGLFISSITWLFLEEGLILFGILHFIGISIILAYLFIEKTSRNLLLGLLFIIVGLYLQTMRFNFSSLMWLGFMPQDFYTLDYFPIFPWFGLILIGLFLGNSLYPNYKRKFNVPKIANNQIVRFFRHLGQRSLMIYLIHQPLLIILLHTLGIITIF